MVKSWGCWSTIILLCLVTISVFFTLSNQAVEILSPPSAMGTLEILDAPPPSLVITVEAHSTPSAFVLQNNEILYDYADTIACEKIIQGQVFDLDGEPRIDDIKVVVQVVEESDANNTIGFRLPGTDQSVGLSGWSMLIPNYDFPHFIWLESISTGNILSQKIFTPTPIDCEPNLIIVNFVQVLPIE